MLAVRPSDTGTLHDYTAERSGRAKFYDWIGGIERLEESPATVNHELSQDYLSLDLGDDISLILRTVRRFDDDDASVPELGRHAVAQYLQGIRFKFAAAFSHDQFLFCPGVSGRVKPIP